MSGMQRILIRCMEALFALRQPQVSFCFRAILIGVLTLLPATSFADGSKDLVKNGGYRPFLEAGYNRSTAGIDRLNRFYVFARSGETLQLGSSAFGLYEGDIRYTRPDGVSGSCAAIKPANAGRSWGVIENLAQEKAGPLPAAGGYTACELIASDATEGVWEITFIAPAPESWKFSSPVTSSVDWVQAADVYTIAAWDISVQAEDGAPVEGRVYAQHLPLNMGGPNEPFASQLYIVTRDGYQYQIDYNDARGHTLLILANDVGFQNSSSDSPVYRSVKLDPLNTLNDGLPDGVKLKNPQAGDSEGASTHKLFFAPPAGDLPVAAMLGTEPAWLINNTIEPAIVSALTYTGSVGKTGSFFFYLFC